MNWKYIEKGEHPLTYKKGDWDGNSSDLVLAENMEGKQFIAQLYEGFLDGANFQDWYQVDTLNKNDWHVDGICRWMYIPD